MRPTKKQLLAALAALLAAAALLFTINQCSRRYPERFQGNAEFDTPTSLLTLSFTIPYADLADRLDQALDGVRYEKTLSIAKASSEKITLRLEKSGPASLSSKNGELLCTMPLRVRATLAESSLGESFTKLVRPLEAEAFVSLATPLAVTPDWQFDSRFRVSSVNFTREPLLWIGPLGLNLTGAVERMLEMESERIGGELDSFAAKQDVLRHSLEKGWLELQRPMAIGGDAFPAWITLSADTLRASLEPLPAGLACHLAITGTLQASADTIGQAPATPLPPFRELDDDGRNSAAPIILHAAIPFSELDRRLEAALAGRQFKAGPHTTTIAEIETYATAKGVAAAVTTTGELHGTLFLSGTPVFDPRNQQLRLDNLDFTLSQNPAAGSAEALLQPALRTILEPYASLDVGKLSALLRREAGRIPGLELDSIRVTRVESIPDRRTLHLLLHAETVGSAQDDPVGK